jgi:TRAP transporter 4TM/12TM fusion protein
MMAVTFAMIPAMVHRIIFFNLVLLLLFTRKGKSTCENIVNAVSVLFLIAMIVYVLHEQMRISTRIAYVAKLLPQDYFFGIGLVILTLEATRRVGGNVLLGLVLVFVAYGFWGGNLPGLLSHSGISLRVFLEMNIMTTGGIFGIPIGAVISFIFYFLLFTAFLEISGGGKLFIDLSLAAAGRFRGGTAKAGVTASYLLGLVNGSAVANCVAVGSLMIPIMKDNGFDKNTSGGIIAAAATGGQLTPPIMGAAAFVMAETLGVPYTTIALAALLPGFLYYFGVFAQVNFYAINKKLEGIKKENLPDIKMSLKRYGHMMIPLVALVLFIASGSSIMRAGLNSTAMLIILSFIRKETRMWPKKILQALNHTVAGLPSIAIPCAAAGIIVSMVINTNMATKFTRLFVVISGGNIIISLICVMVVCIIIGLGMPTISAYIIVALLMVPAIVNLGIPVLAAHMFAFYFALLSFVTPPVALASYTAAGIAKGDPNSTCWIAFRFTFAGFIVPFIFAFDQSLLLQGDPAWIIWRFAVTCIAVWIMAGALSGRLIGALSMVERIVAFGAAIMVILPFMATDFIGLGAIGALFILSWKKNKRELRTVSVAAA